VSRKNNQKHHNEKVENGYFGLRPFSANKKEMSVTHCTSSVISGNPFFKFRGKYRHNTTMKN
jgi:hypothetical protein